MCFFLYVVYELLVGLAAATAQEQDPVIKGKIQQAQVWTVVSWCTYPVVYLFPMVGLGGCRSVTWLHLTGSLTSRWLLFAGGMQIGVPVSIKACSISKNWDAH